MRNYQDFLKDKQIVDHPTGINCSKFNPKLFDFQKDIVRWALIRGRAAIFADCGMGKTAMQLEWAKNIPGDTLILAPLSVTEQTKREGKKFDILVNVARKQQDCVPGINITNYEMLEHFEPSKFNGIILDESSILKSFDGKTRTAIIENFGRIPFRLACTATPAPNDYMELGNHSEFLGVMSRTEMLSMFFVHDMMNTQDWRLKGHAQDKFWQWICSWAVNIRKPSDLGYDDDGFKLPKLQYHDIIVQATRPTDGMLFAMPASSMAERLDARRETIQERVLECSKVVNKTPGQWIVWCNLNSESQQLTNRIKGAIEITGAQSNDVKERNILGFMDGNIRVLVSKPSILGYGLNLQFCSNMAFVGLNDSYEQFYQAVRRCWRFGQKKPVQVFMVSASTEGAVIENIRRKEADAEKMANEMLKHTQKINRENIKGATARMKMEYRKESRKSGKWEMRLGDSVEEVAELKTSSIDYSVYSPPFASLYTYSNSDRDMGNCTKGEQFSEHYAFLVKEIFRATKPGRLTSFHCMNLPTSKVRDGFIGIKDFRGELIRIHEQAGWIFHSEVCIWKDPVTAMQRTKALGLLHKQIKKDSCMSRQGIPDYVVTMRKPGENPERVIHTNETFPVDLWQKIASPVWMDINPNETLQYRSARENNDERHICPLQLEVIRRCLMLWSNPNDLVLSPFAGIGSEGYESLRYGRRFLGIELKETYWKCAVNNLIAAERELKEAVLI